MLTTSPLGCVFVQIGPIVPLGQSSAVKNYAGDTVTPFLVYLGSWIKYRSQESGISLRYYNTVTCVIT